MDDEKIIRLPDGRPAKSRNKPRIFQPCGDRIAIRMDVKVDRSVTIEGDSGIFELGAGSWVTIPLEVWKRTVEIAVRKAAEMPDETPEERAKRRLLQSLDRRN